MKTPVHWEPLGCGIEVLVSDAHRFNTDTVLLAYFAAPKPTERACDLGSGCGAIPLLWCRKNPPRSVAAVELQRDACALLRQSVERNGLCGRVRVLEGDLREMPKRLGAECFDLITCNPPYKPLGTGLVNPDEGKRTARHETSCTHAQILHTAVRLLRFGGRFCLCQRPERLCDVVSDMREAGLEPKKLRFVQARAQKEPKLFLIEGRKGGNPGLTAAPTLLLEDENGGLSMEMKQVYKEYAEVVR